MERSRMSEPGEEEERAVPRQETMTISRARKVTGIDIPALMTTTEVIAWLGMNRKAIDKAIAEFGFPRPLDLGASMRRFRRDQILEWIEARTPKSNSGKGKGAKD